MTRYPHLSFVWKWHTFEISPPPPHPPPTHDETWEKQKNKHFARGSLTTPAAKTRIKRCWKEWKSRKVLKKSMKAGPPGPQPRECECDGGQSAAMSLCLLGRWQCQSWAPYRCLGDVWNLWSNSFLSRFMKWNVFFFSIFLAFLK